MIFAYLAILAQLYISQVCVFIVPVLFRKLWQRGWKGQKTLFFLIFWLKAKDILIPYKSAIGVKIERKIKYQIKVRTRHPTIFYYHQIHTLFCHFIKQRAI